MGYKGNFESYKNLTRDNPNRYNNHKWDHWNNLKGGISGARSVYKANKGFIRKFIDWLKYGKLNKGIV